MDTNNFELISSAISGISYVQNSFVITQGEDFKLPPTFSRNGSTWTMTVLADREGSEPVAQAFISATGGPSHEVADTLEDTTPQELNFCFSVIVTFSIGGAQIPVTLWVGQGHRVGANNWWLGGAQVNRTGDSTANLLVSNGSVQVVFQIKADTSEMTLTP